MAYNKDRPVSSRTLRKSAGYLRDNFQQLEITISEGHRFDTGGTQDGKHVTPTFIDNGGAPSQPTVTNEARLYNNAGEMRVLYQSGRDDPLRDIPSGTKMIFKQSSAPVGWTFNAEDNDRVMLNTSTESEGGSTGGGWTIDGVSIAGHALTEAELPSVYGEFQIRKLGLQTETFIVTTMGNMSVNYNGGNSVKDVESAWYGDGNYTADVVRMEFGGDNAHSHAINTDGTWRPAYAKVITCQKQ